MRDCRLYPKSKGTHLKDFRQEWLAQFWCSIEINRREQEWVLESQLGAHVKENGALVWDGGRKRWILIRCLGNSINRLDDCIALVPCPFSLLCLFMPSSLFSHFAFSLKYPSTFCLVKSLITRPHVTAVKSSLITAQNQFI